MEVAEGCLIVSTVTVHTIFSEGLEENLEERPKAAALLGSRANKGIRKFKKLKARPKGEKRKDHKLWLIKYKNAMRVAKKKNFI